ncbi:S8 family serine peptidase [candidate division KSB1 bacterium]|nr:S8 family serine peptidase [candidate division KSB1 bacterium]
MSSTLKESGCKRGFRRLFSTLFISCIGFSALFSSANESDDPLWTFLSTQSIGAAQFVKANPTYDGRGVVIFILDTGVDPAVSGLRKTSTGDTKVIDVRDFTGQGDVDLYFGESKMEGDESYITHPDGLRLCGFDAVDFKPTNNEYLIGYLDEERFINSRVDDINNNYIIDDHFGILVFEAKRDDAIEVVAYIDTDADGHIDDEKPIHDYHVNYETFQLRGRNRETDKNLLTFAINISIDEMRVSIHFDDSGHGTHVAGIAAGYQINDQAGFNGVAPGAQIISLKVGNNTYAGGASVSGSIKRALRFGIDYIRENDVAGVFNLSYGLGSEYEGNSVLEQHMDRLLADNEDIMICLSAGNMGPGISSSGCPASSYRAIATGALLPRTIARDIYGASLPDDKVFIFSARGGEVNKPDLLAPGAAISCVPDFRSDAEMQGTSMASPHAAGAVALLMSAVLQQNTDAPLKGAIIKRALKYSGSLVRGYDLIEQGTGIINVPRAHEISKSCYDQNEFNMLLDYQIETNCPAYPDGKGTAAFWRAGGYFPPETEPQAFFIKAIFPSSLEADQRAAFFRSFELRSSDDWLSAEKRFVFIKGENSARIDVRYNADKMKEPGLYSGKISAYRKGNDETPEFELKNTIIIPHQFHALNQYQKCFMNQKLSPGSVERYFILVPPAASMMQVKFQAVKDKWCEIVPYLFDPDGHRYSVLARISSRKENEVIKTLTTENLQPGIWEIVAYCPFEEVKPSYFNAEVNFTGLSIDPPKLTTFEYEMGTQPTGQFSIRNQFNRPFDGTAKGLLAGYKRTRRIKLSAGDDDYRYYFKTSPDVDRIVFETEMSRDVFLNFTDVALNIVGQDEQYVVKEGMNFRLKRIQLSNPGSGQYTFELLAALADPDFAGRWEFLLTEYHYLRQQDYIDIYVKKDGRSTFQVYPDQEVTLDFTLEDAPRVAPSGFVNFGLIFLKDKYSREIQTTLPVAIKTGVE